MPENDNSNISAIELPSHHPFVGIDLPWLLRERAESEGEKTFLIWEPSEGEATSWSYTQTHKTITRLASGLASRGVKAGDTVLIHLDNAPESIFLWFACAMIGAIAVTTNPRCAGEELAYFAEKTKAVGIVTQPWFAALVKEYLPTINWSIFTEPCESEVLLGSDEPLANRSPNPAAPFCIQFTSGTTSRPKAVLWTHANALWGAMVNARHLGLVNDDVAHIFNPMCHTFAQSWQVLASLWVGASVVLQPKFSASRYWDVIVRNECTWTAGGDFAMRALGDTPIPGNHKLRFVMSGVQQKPENDPWGLRNFAAHGMTETITHTFYSDPIGPIEPGVIGRPAAEYELKIVDAEGNPVARGEPGELLLKGVRGLSIFTEYYDDPETTSKAFTTEGYFRTGDLVCMNESGSIVFVDRLKDMLKVGGENVAASEIEVVARRVNGVKEVTVVAQPHPMLDEVPYAFVIADADAPRDLEDQLIKACQKALADFKVPRGVRLVDDFPRTTGGMKIAKAQLRDLLKEEYKGQ